MSFTPFAKKLIAVCALLGAIMSGYLSYQNYFNGGCKANSFLTCGAGPAKVSIFGQPTCIYGFVMFLATFILIFMAWNKTQAKGLVTATLIVGTVGVLFSLFLSTYEIFWLKALDYGPLPSCVYGLIFYIGIWIGTWQSFRQKTTTPPPGVLNQP